MFHIRGIISLTFEHQILQTGLSEHQFPPTGNPPSTRISAEITLEQSSAPPQVTHNPSCAGPDVPETVRSDPFLSPGRAVRPWGEGGGGDPCEGSKTDAS